MAAFQQLVKLLPAVAGGELLKIDGVGAAGDVGVGLCVSKHSTDRIAHIRKSDNFRPTRAPPLARAVRRGYNLHEDTFASWTLMMLLPMVVSTLSKPVIRRIRTGPPLPASPPGR